MCTVTYIPTSKGFIFTTNRDESPSRDVDHLAIFYRDQKKIMYPPDHKGGSWVACSDKGEIICLLNGAFQAHKHTPPYKHSRGKIVVDYFNEHNSYSYKEYIANLDLNGIEPFTLIVIDDNKIVELRWDERIKHIHTIDTHMPYIWSSATIYDDESRQMREDNFQSFIKTGKDISEFHRSSPFGNKEIDMLMKRPFVETISITRIEKIDAKIKVEYENLIKGFTLIV